MDAKTDELELLTPAEVSEKLRLSLGTTYQLIKSGELPARRFRRSYRIEESELQAYYRRSRFVERAAS